MENRKLSKSKRKYIRKEKARIRRDVLDVEKQKELIKKLNSGLIRVSMVKNS